MLMERDIQPVKSRHSLYIPKWVTS